MQITIENYRKQVPFILNMEAVREKGMGRWKPNERYFALTNKYKRMFERFLKSKLPLEQINLKMRESELDFVPIPHEKMDFYQMTSGMELEYIYLRNNLYVEKLSEEDLKLLELLDVDGDTEDFVSRTWMSVINPYDDEHEVFYGPENANFLSDSATPVIGIRYDEFETELDGEEFKNNFLKKQEIISQICIVNVLCGLKELKTSVSTIQYNEVSAPRL